MGFQRGSAFVFSQTGLGPGIYDLAMTSCEVGPITIPGLWLPQVIRFSMDPWTPIQGLCGFKASHTFLWPPWRLQVPPPPRASVSPPHAPTLDPDPLAPFFPARLKTEPLRFWLSCVCPSLSLVALCVSFFVCWLSWVRPSLVGISLCLLRRSLLGCSSLLASPSRKNFFRPRCRKKFKKHGKPLVL